MPRLRGEFVAQSGDRYAIVVSRFNAQVTAALEEGARDTLTRYGIPLEDIDVIEVPGAFEIAFAARRAVEVGYAAVVCLGAVVRGDTPHFDYVASNTASRIAQLAATAPVPVLFAVLTCDTMEQARDRAGGKAGNKGSEAAVAALEMVSLTRRLSPPASGDSLRPR